MKLCELGLAEVKCCSVWHTAPGFADPVDGGRFTVKRYRSTKTRTADGWEHQSITLQPLNPKFSPISVDPDEATELRVIGEFVAVAFEV